MFQDMTLKSEMQPVLMRHLRESDQHTVANAFHELIVTDLRPEVARITAPVTVLYVQPANTPTPVSPEQFDATMAGLYAGAPNARMVKIDDSRHFIQWDQPARFVGEVAARMRR